MSKSIIYQGVIYGTGKEVGKFWHEIKDIIEIDIGNNSLTFLLRVSSIYLPKELNTGSKFNGTNQTQTF